MELKKCKNGHSYNAILGECPECANADTGTQAVDFPDLFSFGNSFSSGNNIGMFDAVTPKDEGHGGTTPVKVTNRVNSDNEFSFPSKDWSDQNNYRKSGTVPVTNDYNVTQAIEPNRGVQLVCGWLVCLSGEEKGQDYRIHTDYNYIGRSSHMDICLKDDSVSRENHAIIAYDSRSGVFLFAPVSGRTSVRHNGNMVLGTVELKHGDRLEIGRGEYMFVPLCGENFKWM